MRFTALIVVLTMICGIFGGNLSVSAIGANPLIGDVDEDGVLTVSDALRILRVCVGFAEYDENMLEVYDVWGDGDVDVKDALGILRSSIGVIGSFGRTGVKFIFEPNTMASEAGVTQEMLDRAIVHTEGTARLAKVMDKAARGEDISIVTIGGSVTQGYGIDVPEERYANIVSSWWEEAFPQANVNFTNAGIGGTGSIFGVHRLERDVFEYDPDLLIVEFAVNDKNDESVGTAESFEALIRRVLLERPNTAVIALFMVAKYCDSPYQKPIAEAYSIPIISFREAILPELDSGRFTWKGIMPDELHPNTQGHAITGGLITSYLDGVKSVYADSTRIEPLIPETMLYGDRYMNAKMYWAGDEIEGLSLGSWKLDGYKYYDYTGSWYSSVSKRAFEFETEFKSIVIFYERTAIESESGTVKISVTGERPVYVRSYFENGWEYLTAASVFSGESTEKRTVKITTTDGKFRIAAIFIA